MPPLVALACFMLDRGNLRCKCIFKIRITPDLVPEDVLFSWVRYFSSFRPGGVTGHQTSVGWCVCMWNCMNTLFWEFIILNRKHSNPSTTDDILRFTATESPHDSDPCYHSFPQQFVTSTRAGMSCAKDNWLSLHLPHLSLGKTILQLSSFPCCAVSAGYTALLVCQSFGKDLYPDIVVVVVELVGRIESVS